jgi:hypothetical protein
MKELFSVEHLGRNWGTCLLLSAIVSFGAQEVFGLLYDEHVPEDMGNNCYGMNCVQEGYGVFVGVSVVGFILGAIILIRKRCCQCLSASDNMA